MYGIYANIWGILMVNLTIYGIHGSYGLSSIPNLLRATTFSGPLSAFVRHLKSEKGKRRRGSLFGLFFSMPI